MAMTKNEQQIFAEMKTELRKALALRFPDYVPERISMADVRLQKQEGWTFNAHTGQVERGWFCSVSHGYGWPPREGVTGSRSCGGPWYRSKKEALMALRIELSHRYAKQLADLDLIIAES